MSGAVHPVASPCANVERRRPHRAASSHGADMSNVTIENLDIRLSGVDIISGLNLDVRSGEFLVLLGPSGCGKSTLLHSIAGLIDVHDGRIEIAGTEVTWA